MITLATLPQATAQQVFDQVARHMLTQKAKSWDESVSWCAYRSDDGLKCAAGCLIADDEYSSAMERLVWSDVVYNDLAPVEHVNLVEALQLVHDAHAVRDWPAKLKEVAVEYQLNADVLKEFE